MAEKSGVVADISRGKLRPARDALELSVRMKLRVVFSSAKRQSREIEERCGVSGGQLWALSELDKQPGLRVSDLAQALFVKNSTASNLVDRIEQHGWVRRERNGKDQRVVQLYLTPAGAKLLARCPVPPRGVVTEALRLISLDSLEALEHSLEELTSRLALKDSDAGLTPLTDM
jgi:DNA-binding MarR family transcriptional regulator